MTAFTVEQKSQLAKLMATENLSIQHQKIQTAKFDPVNRILYLPIWKDMSGAMYDLLGGHEVGHALYTPADGWHDAAVDTTKHKNYKSFLNVVEDARIEKKVIRKYPGLKSSFRKAYAELHMRDFFGLGDRDVNTMSFIERLNIFTKSQYTQAIDFNNFEMQLIGKIQMLETWEDTMRVTDEVYEYSKGEQLEKQQELGNDFNFEEDADGDYEESDDYDSNSEDSDYESDDESKDSSETTDTDAEESEDDTEDGEGVDEINRNKQSQESESSYEDFDPVCETDNNFRNNESILLDNKCKSYVYIEMPKVNMHNCITPAKRVQELISEHYMDDINNGRLTYATINEYVKDFRNKNERYIGLLAKEFEMRKAAKAFSKSKLSDTGDIDVNKLSLYQFDDNIFRKVMMVPKGKSHGLILLLDCSGSMSDNMSGSIEQILILSLFCRKVNIPFHVYGFTDDSGTWYYDRKINEYDPEVREKIQRDSFVRENNHLTMSNVQLREYLNHKMSNAEFTRALRNMILLKVSYMGNRHSRKISRPHSEQLSNTPLTQAIIVTRDLMLNFKKVNNLDLTNLVIVHDGDADYISSFINSTGDYSSFSPDYENVIMRDKKFQYESQMASTNGNGCPTFRAVLEWFNKTTHAKVFGFYIIEGRPKASIQRMYVDDSGQSFSEMSRLDRFAAHEIERKVMRDFRSEKFIVSKRKGYTSFFMIAGGSNLIVDNEEIEIEGKVTANKLKNAFMKFNRGKQVNRVLVSKFIQGIAV